MFIVGLLRWWYTDGWKQRAQMVMTRLDGTMDYFSVGLLLRTMFSLFRQDGAGQVDGPLSLKINAFMGRLISRCLGATIRSFVLIVGLIVITSQALMGLMVLILWLGVPLFPVIGVVMSAIGWVPWQY